MTRRSTPYPANQREFDQCIGHLDRMLSEFLGLYNSSIDEPNRQTLKHHADDLIGVGQAMLSKLNPPPVSETAGKSQPCEATDQ